MAFIEIPVDNDVAEAFYALPADKREEILSFPSLLLTDLIRRSLDKPRTREESIERLKKLSDEIGKEAAANGWTDEMNEALLRGDFDHE